MLKPIPP